MARQNHYPRSLPTYLNDAGLDPILRRYHSTACQVDELLRDAKVLRQQALAVGQMKVTRAEIVVVNRLRRVLEENQGYRELYLIAIEAPDQEFLMQPMVVVEGVYK